VKFDLYMRTDLTCIETNECVMWLVLPMTCVFFLADGRYGYDSLYTVKIGLLDTDNWVKFVAGADAS